MFRTFYCTLVCGDVKLPAEGWYEILPSGKGEAYSSTSCLGTHIPSRLQVKAKLCQPRADGFFFFEGTGTRPD